MRLSARTLKSLTLSAAHKAFRTGIVVSLRVRRVARVLYHVVVVALSAGVALLLPSLFSLLAENLLAYWSFVANEKFFVTSVEILAATLLILCFDALQRIWRDRRLSRMASAAGIVYFTSSRRFLSKRRFRRLREQQAFGKDIMLIGSTGFRSFVRPEGEFHNVLRHAREARIMLLNPFGHGAQMRAKAILDPGVTPDTLKDQVWESIAFLKALRATQKSVRLKLYPDAPFLKLAILGDHLWLQHYHAGLDVQHMPECMLRYDQTPRGLYTLFYDHFRRRWNDPNIPEYDLETDELVYRDGSDNAVKRETFHAWRSDGTPAMHGAAEQAILRRAGVVKSDEQSGSRAV